jgi:hypothetical protein
MTNFGWDLHGFVLDFQYYFFFLLLSRLAQLVYCSSLAISTLPFMQLFNTSILQSKLDERFPRGPVFKNHSSDLFDHLI